MNNFGLEASAHPPCKDNTVQHKDALMHILKSERCWQWKKSKRVFQLGFGLSQKLFQTPQKAKFRDLCIFSLFFLVWKPFSYQETMGNPHQWKSPS